MKKLIVSLCVVMIVLVSTVSFIGCSQEETPGTQVVTDMLGRDVTVPTNPQRVVCIGAGALRLYSYVGDMSKLCGVENVEKTDSTYGGNLAIRPYKEVNQELFDSLQDCGKGGPQNQAAEPESIIACNPDLVISLMDTDVAATNALQEQIGVPVIRVLYDSANIFSDVVSNSIKLLGKALNKEDRANDVVNYMNTLKADLVERTSDIAESEKPSVYLGCHSSWGKGGFLSSSANYAIFNLLGVKNAITASDFVTKDNKTLTDLEKLVDIDPDKIIIDLGGLDLMKGEYALDDTAAIYNSLTALKNGEVYTQFPFNAYYTNIETVYINAYYIGSVVYPDKFSDVNISEKADEIFVQFLHHTFYSEMVDEYGALRKLNLAATFPKYDDGRS